MRFSQRTNWNTEESELAEAHRLRVEAGLPIADLTASNPTRCGFEYPPDLLAALGRSARALDYDPQPRGLLRGARGGVRVLRRTRQFPWLRSQVVLTTSTSEAYSYLFRLLCDPGSEIVVPQPGYPLFDFLAVLDDVRLKSAPLVYDHGWQIDPEGFRRAITPATRAIVLVHPNNPTGHFTKRWEAEELARICREFDLSLIVDEVFLDYRLRGPDAGRVEFCGRSRRRTGVRGERVEQDRRAAADEGGMDRRHRPGADACAGTAGSHRRYLSLHERPGAMGSAGLARRSGTRSSARSESGLRPTSPNWIDNLDGRRRCRRLMSKVAGTQCCEFRRSSRTRLTVRELLDRGVWVHPGYFFGMQESGWLVVACSAPEAEFSTGVPVILEYLRDRAVSNSTERVIQVILVISSYKLLILN